MRHSTRNMLPEIQVLTYDVSSLRLSGRTLLGRYVLRIRFTVISIIALYVLVGHLLHQRIALGFCLPIQKPSGFS